MRLFVDLPATETAKGSVIAEHNGQTARFGFSMYNREDFVAEGDVFGAINLFWSQQTAVFQQEVFDLYREAEEIFNDVFKRSALNEELKGVVTKLSKLHPMALMRKWLINTPGYAVPKGFSKDYIDDPDKNTSRIKTYVQDDYRDLLTYSFVLRLMVPIWTAYMRQVKSHYGKNFRELQAFRLMEDSEVSRCSAVEKLHAYAKANLRDDSHALSPESFISDEDYPYLLVTMVSVRKLAIGDLSPENDRANLVTLVSNFIKSKTVFPDSDLASTIREKRVDGGSTDGNDMKASVMEAFRVNTEISIEEVEEIKFSAADIYNLIRNEFSDLDMDLFNDALATAEIIQIKQSDTSVRILPPQRTLAAWVLKNGLTPFGFDYLDMPTQIKCLALTQARLWQRGHHYLALLSTSVADVDESSHRVASGVGRSRVPEALLTELRQVFPHVRLLQSRKAPPREECPVMNDIELLTAELSSYNWRATCSPRYLEQVFGDSKTRAVPVLPEIRIALTKLAIDVGSNRL